MIGIQALVFADDRGSGNPTEGAGVVERAESTEAESTSEFHPTATSESSAETESHEAEPADEEGIDESWRPAEPTSDGESGSAEEASTPEEPTEAGGNEADPGADDLPLTGEMDILPVEQRVGESEISGEVSDTTTLEPIAGAIVSVKGTGREAETDADGRFRISGLPQGDYIVEALKLGYSAATTTASPRPDTPARVRLALRVKPTSDTADGEYLLAEEAVVGEYRETNQGDFNLDIQAAPNITAGIGKEEFTSSGVSDAGDAVSKISGANIVGGKYAVVRGLGDRYSNTLVNGSQISSADPSKKAVQLDLFPSDLLQSVAIYKTFTPNLPAEFAGGTVAVETLRFPEKRIISFEVGTGWNSNLDGATMRTVPDRERDFFGEANDGISSAIRDTLSGLPSGYSGTRPLDRAPASQRAQAAESAEAFAAVHASGGMRPGFRSARPDESLSLILGDTFDLGGSELGAVIAFTRGRKDSIRDNVRVGRFFNVGPDGIDGTADDSLNRSAIENRFSTEVNWGALGSFGLKMADRHEIGLTLFTNVSSQDNVTVADRQRRVDGDNLSFLRAASTPGDAGAMLYQGYEVIEPLRRELELLQVNGKHQLGDPEVWSPELSWAFSHSDSLEERPHTRSLLYYILDYTDPRIRDEFGEIYRPELGVLVTAADVPAATQGTGTLQSFRESLSTDETATNMRADLTIPLLREKEDRAWDLRVGASSFSRDREVRGRLFTYEIPGPLNQQLVAGLGEAGTAFLDQWDSPTGLDGEPKFNGWTGNGGRIRSDRLFITEATRGGRTVRNVDAFSDLESWYAMSSLNLGQWDIAGGFRVEQETRGYEVLSGLNLAAFATPRIEETNTNVLPGITVSRTFGRDDSILASMGWSRTIARPTFYEFAPVQTEDQASGDVIVGNPNLQDTLIDNFDLSVAWAGEKGTSLAANLFHKSMDQPIAQAYDLFRRTWVNGVTGTVQGFEVEARQQFLDRWSISGNYTYINSLLQYDQVIGTSGTQRINSSFEGQPENIFNLNFGYEDPDHGFKANLVYNFTGSYLTGVPLSNTSPAIVRDSFQTLDLILSQQVDAFGGVGTVKLKFGNLLDSTDTEWFGDSELAFRSFKPGRSASLSFELEY